MPQDSQSCFLHGSEWQCQLVLECRQNDKHPPTGIKHLATDLQTLTIGRRRLGGMGNSGQLNKDETPNDGPDKCRTNLERDDLGHPRRRVSSYESTPFSSGMEDYDMVEKEKCLGDDPTNATRWKHKFGFHRGGDVRHADDKMGRGADMTGYIMWHAICFERTTWLWEFTTRLEKKREGIPSKNREIWTPWCSSPRRNLMALRGNELAVRSGSVVDWIHGHAKQKTTTDDVRSAQEQLCDWWGRGVGLRRRKSSRLGSTHFREHSTEADAWAEKGVRDRNEEWEDASTFAWTVWVLGWELSRRRMRCRNVDQYFCTRSHNLQEMWAGARQEFFDAEIAGCSMLSESLIKWVNKCVYVHFVSPWCHPPVTRCICRWNASHASWS